MSKIDLIARTLRLLPRSASILDNNPGVSGQLSYDQVNGTLRIALGNSTSNILATRNWVENNFLLFDNISIVNNVIETTVSNTNLELRANGTGQVVISDTLSASSTVGLSPSNSNVTISPTGTGTVSINPATAGNIDNMNIGASTRGTGAFTTLNVVASSSTDALRITQTGAGNALVVEDSTNPDATPFVVNASGQVLIGRTTAPFGSTSLAIEQSAADTAPSNIDFLKNRAGAIVNSGDGLGRIRFWGYDGASNIDAAEIVAAVDGTPGTNDMPGRLVFSTTADGASTPTERMRINNAGLVGIGTSSLANNRLRVSFSLTDAAATSGAILADGTHTLTANNTVQYSNIESQAVLNQEGFNQTTSLASGGGVRGFRGFPTVSGASGTVTAAVGYSADVRNTGAGVLTNGAGFVAQGVQNTGGGTLTNAMGFYAAPQTGGTNNYGFYSDVASGTGRWNFYANGTANNYFGGATTISTSSASDALRITQTGAGNALVVEDSANPDSTPFVVDASGKVVIGYTANLDVGTSFFPQLEVFSAGSSGSIASGRWGAATGGSTYQFVKSRGASVGTNGIVSSGDTIGTLGFSADDGTAFISAATITAAVDGTPGTNDMPGRLVFSTTADGASSPTERMRIDNIGRIGINSTALTGYQFRIAGTYASTDVNPIWLGINGTIPSTATGQAYGFFSGTATQAATFTLTGLNHFFASQGGVGAGSTLTNQYGFRANSNLTGATNNYGFYSDIASGTGRWNFYANGTADNYFAGQVQLGAGTAAAPALSTTGDTNTGIFFPAADTIAFSEGGAESMRIDSSGNVGIGTSSPSTLAKLAVAGADDANLFGLSSTTGVLRAVAYRTSSAGAVVEATNAAQSAYANLFLNGLNLLLGTGGSERLRIDTSGNVGIGTNSPGSKLDVNGDIRDSKGNVRSVVQNAQAGAYDLVASDAGKHIRAGGNVGVNSGIFSIGDTVVIYNNTAGNITITQGASVTLRLVGTTTTGSRTLAQRGLATILCVASNEFVVTGGGLT